MSKRTISGKTIRFSDWKARVLAEADRVNLCEEARELANEAMLRDGFEKNETPAYFVFTVQNLYHGELDLPVR